MPGLACVGTDAGQSLVAWRREPDDKVQLPAAEQMIDELDRIMTAYGTISVKIPDVWGQDRLARFRCEYESQMAAWLKAGFKGDINASVRHSEAEATRVQVGADVDSAPDQGHEHDFANERRQSRYDIEGASGHGRDAPGLQLPRR